MEMKLTMKRYAIGGGWIGMAVLAVLLAACAGFESTTVHYSTNVISLTGSNFEQQVVASAKPALVDFWSPTCPPCVTVAPTISELADAYRDRVVVGAVNFDDETALAEKYDVEGVPTFLIFKGGKPVQKLIGPLEKKEFEELLEKVLAR
jgi:thioredoxin 1